MDLIPKLLHGRKFFVGLDSLGSTSALPLPTVIDVDIIPTVLVESCCNKSSCRAKNLLLADLTTPTVPAIPSHGRSQGNLLACHYLESASRLTLGIGRDQQDGIFSGLRELAGDTSCSCIQGQSCRKPLGRKNHRPVTGGGDRVEKR